MHTTYEIVPDDRILRCKRSVIVVFIVAVLLMAAQTSYAATVSNYVITADPLANSSCQTPATKTTFSPSDNAVYLWSSISNAVVGDTVEWRWFSPDNSLYNFSTYTSTYNANICVWGGILVSGHEAANLQGNWRAELYLNGILAVTSNFTIGVAPGLPAPKNLRFTLSGNNLTISWDAVTGAAGYNLLIGFAPGRYLPGAFDMGNTTRIGPIDVSGGSGTFYLAVQAYSGSIEGSNSNEIVINIGSASGLPAPENFRYTINGNILTLQWDFVPGASGYNLFAGLQSGNYIIGPFDVGNSLSLPLDISGVTGTYYLAAEAYNSSQRSGYSGEIAVKLGSVNPQPFDTAGVTNTLFGALGQFYNPNTTPIWLNTVKNTFASGGLNAVDILIANMYPQLITKLRNGIFINYGSGFTDQLGHLMSGSILATHSNLVESASGGSGNYSLVVDNLYANGKFLADGSASGSFNFRFAPLLVADISINGVLNAAGLSSARNQLELNAPDIIASGTYGSVNGSVHIDRNQCPNFPVSGSVTYTIGGQTNTLTFNNNCNTSAYGITSGSHPTIVSLTPNSGKPGDQVTIGGTGFGAAQGASTVMFAGTLAQVVSWSDTSIVVLVPNITSTGNVIVTVGGNASNGVQFTVINQCSTQQVSGADTPETRVIDLGINHGTFQFFYDTYSQQDRIIVSYQGTVLFDTGCVGASGTQYLTYSGTSTSVTVDVHPNCAGGTGTAWNFTVYCP